MFIPELFGSPGPDAHQQVGTPEQNMEPVHILGNATVCNFPIPEIPLDYEKYEKGVLDLTANRRDAIFHLLFPVDSLIVFGCFQAGGTLTNAVIDLGQVFILYDILLFRNFSKVVASGTCSVIKFMPRKLRMA